MSTGQDEMMFEEVASTDFLCFSFAQTTYQRQLNMARDKSGVQCAIDCKIVTSNGRKMVWLQHNWGFLGGSLGCAEGEKLCLGLEYATTHKIPCVVVCRSGGARMQEGTLSLMQMAKVSVAVAKFKQSGQQPFITIFLDPTYGGVSASYASQGDIRISVSGARIGFAGPAIILNTVYEMDQAKYDLDCPPGFQSAEFLNKHGHLDIVLESKEQIQPCVDKILATLQKDDTLLAQAKAVPPTRQPARECAYLNTRKLNRYQPVDVITALCRNFVELSGDGMAGKDKCITGGIGNIKGQPVVIVATRKGHTPGEMAASNYGMGDPVGYRTALRLMKLAEQYSIPIVSLVDTCGAYPSFQSESEGQSEALATNLLFMSKCSVPIISILVGEGGSGGALAIAMGDSVAMLERGYYAVISPEGAASILGRYKDEAHKKSAFPVDCAALAEQQNIYAWQLEKLGVIDTIILEEAEEDCGSWPLLQARISAHILTKIQEFSALPIETLLQKRYQKFRGMGKFSLQQPDHSRTPLSPNSLASRSGDHRSQSPLAAPRSTFPREGSMDKLTAMNSLHSLSMESLDDWSQGLLQEPTDLLKYIGDLTINGTRAAYLGRQPSGMGRLGHVPLVVDDALRKHKAAAVGAKQILDKSGPEAVVAWVKSRKEVLLTDTTMRDAQQSLLATRVRTVDMIAAADYTSHAMANAFSLEVWGGATFDVCMRFLRENPWQRLKTLREYIPNICLQMLIRGSNAVGYTSYPDNVISEFVRLAASAGIDVFRIFDCFNDVSQMEICINAVREAKKLAEVCICFTGNFLDKDEKIYTLEYYKELAQQVEKAGAHLIGLKDMAGLFRPQMAAPFMKAIRSVTSIPIHFHTHNTSSASLASGIAMADNGCEILDFCISSMADLTSQPSLNAFIRSMEYTERAATIPSAPLEQLALYWENVRTYYAPFESGMKAGTARVFDHQIPGGQYSNLIPQCDALGLSNKWSEVLDMYRDVNKLFGDIVKVTPSSKVVGDFATFLVSKNLSTEDVRKHPELIESFPDSVVKMMQGDLGVPHRGWPVDVQKIILRGKDTLKCRPGKLKEAIKLSDVKDKLEDEFEGLELSDEDAMSFILYPDVFRDYVKFVIDHTNGIPYLPSSTFYYGMSVGESIRLLPWNATANESVPTVGTTLMITLKRVQPIKTVGKRTLTFTINTQQYDVTIDEENKDGGVKTRMADKKNTKHIASPMQGEAADVQFSEGDTVPQGETIMNIVSMKMRVPVVAPVDCTIQEVCVSNKDKVLDGSLLVVMQ